MNTFDISPQLKAISGAGKKQSKYPWHTLEPGKCFTVADDKVKLSTLETLAYRTGKRHNKKFKVLHHPEQKLFEVGRIDGIV